MTYIMGDMLDIGAFDSPTFDVNAWINTQIERYSGTFHDERTADHTVDSCVSSMLIQLQLYASECQERLNAGMSGIISALPRTQRDLGVVQGEVSTINKLISLDDNINNNNNNNNNNTAKSPTSPRSMDAKDYIGKIEVLDRAKQRLEHARGLFTHMSAWDRLLRETDSTLECRDLMRIRHHIQSLQRCAESLVHMPDAEVREAIVGQTRQQYQSLLLPLLVSAFLQPNQNSHISAEKHENNTEMHADSRIADTLPQVLTEMEMVGVGQLAVQCIAAVLAKPLLSARQKFGKQQPSNSLAMSSPTHKGDATAKSPLAPGEDVLSQLLLAAQHGTAAHLAVSGSAELSGFLSSFDFLSSYYKLFTTTMRAAVQQLRTAYDAVAAAGGEESSRVAQMRVLEFIARFTALCIGSKRQTTSPHSKQHSGTSTLTFTSIHHFKLHEMLLSSCSSENVRQLLEAACLDGEVVTSTQIPISNTNIHDDSDDALLRDIIACIQCTIPPFPAQYSRSDLHEPTQFNAVRIFSIAAKAAAQTAQCIPTDVACADLAIVCAATVCEHFLAPFRSLSAELPSEAMDVARALFRSADLPSRIAAIPPVPRAFLASGTAVTTSAMQSTLQVASLGMSVPLSAMVAGGSKEVKTAGLPKQLVSGPARFQQASVDLLNIFVACAAVNDTVSLGMDASSFVEAAEETFDELVSRDFCELSALYEACTSFLAPTKSSDVPGGAESSRKVASDWMDEEVSSPSTVASLTCPSVRETISTFLEAQFSIITAIACSKVAREVVMLAARHRANLPHYKSPSSPHTAYDPAICLRDTQMTINLRAYAAIDCLRHNPKKEQRWAGIVSGRDTAPHTGIYTATCPTVLHWAYHFALDSIVAPGLVHLRGLHSESIWNGRTSLLSGEDVAFSLQPSKYIMHVCDHLMAVVQHFAPYGNPIVKVIDDSTRLRVQKLSLEGSSITDPISVSEASAKLPLQLIFGAHAAVTYVELAALGELEWTGVLAKIGLRARPQLSISEFLGTDCPSPLEVIGVPIVAPTSAFFVDSMKEPLSTLVAVVNEYRRFNSMNWVATTLMTDAVDELLPQASTAANNQATAEASLWLHGVIKVLSASILYELSSIPRLDASGAAQLKADYDYFAQVVAAIGVTLDPILPRFIELITMLPRELSKLADASSATAELPLLKLVARMRGAIVSA